MSHLPQDKAISGRRYALCIGIGKYSKLTNHNLRYAVSDAKAVAERLEDPLRGNFKVNLLTEPAQTTRSKLEKAINKMLNGPDMKEEDLVVIYLACHGGVYGKGHTFYFQPSNAELERDGMPRKLTVIDIYGLATSLSAARVKNIIFLLDVCHSGGAGIVFEHLDLNLNPDINFFIIGAARHDQVASQSSRLEHGIFTSCLLDAFEQKPHRSDGWLTISDIFSFVSDALKVEANKFSSEARLVQVQTKTASVNTNLPFVKNPHYSPQNSDFYKEVQKLLELLQYESVKTAIPADAPAGFYVAEVKAGIRTHRVGIIPYYNQLETFTPQAAKKLTAFMKKQAQIDSLDEGLLVTALDISNEAKNILQENGSRTLEARTYESIWKNLIDFRKHLRKLVNEYQSPSLNQYNDPPLAKTYVSLYASRRHYQTKSSSVDIASTARYEIQWEGELQEEVMRWLSDEDSATARLAVLADYGSGKTTFCKHLAAQLAQSYLTAEEHERNGLRIPLHIPLGEFGPIPVDLDGYLVAYLKRRCMVDNVDAAALIKMAHAGLLLFILDGFDEMAARATPDVVRRNIECFEQLAKIPQNKVLLTTRSEYFLTLQQERQVLRMYPCVYILPFNSEQIDLYLQRCVPFLNLNESESRDWKHYKRQIDSIHDLADLSQRPVLLSMIIKTLPTLVTKNKTINRPNLYQHYLEGELNRLFVKQQRDMLIKSGKRFEIMESIALEMYRTNRASLAARQIREVSRELLTPDQQEELDGSLREIVTCSFLTRIQDEYHFSHQSFLDYLVARRLAMDIMTNKQKNLRLKPLTLTIRDFLLELEAGIVQTSSSVEYSTSFKQEQLEIWFRSNPKDKWLSANTISLLANFLSNDQLRTLPFKEADLSDANLVGVDLANVDLTRTILTGADLSRANLATATLARAVLTEATLIETCLEKATLIEADLFSANLAQATLVGADGARANLALACLAVANLEHVNLEKSILTRADLHGANLHRADLRGANLRGANLHGANLRGADLQDADLRYADLHEADLQDANLHGALLDTVNFHAEK